MYIELLEANTGQKVKGIISRATLSDAPLIKEGWSFNWQELLRTEGSTFFKITLIDSPDKIEGIVMLSIYFGEMVYMNNLELAPHNIGKQKKYDWVAGCLIAYGCRFSMEEGKGSYQGFLTFESKSKLIPLYEKKYGATCTLGQKMFIDIQQGEKLIKQYLSNDQFEE
ncbi:MAG: hypothetical protein KDD63_21675 [Bacteroidetes bacterium]|nr:hypothetical protein [Bacteroidota bacterium]